MVEAQAIGRPVLVSDTLSLSEVAGGSACLVDPLQIDSIRQGFRRILDNQGYRAELVELGFKNVERFSSEVTAQAYAGIYRQIA